MLLQYPWGVAHMVYVGLIPIRSWALNLMRRGWGLEPLHKVNYGESKANLIFSSLASAELPWTYKPNPKSQERKKFETTHNIMKAYNNYNIGYRTKCIKHTSHWPEVAKSQC